MTRPERVVAAALARTLAGGFTVGPLVRVASRALAVDRAGCRRGAQHERVWSAPPAELRA